MTRMRSKRYCSTINANRSGDRSLFEMDVRIYFSQKGLDAEQADQFIKNWEMQSRLKTDWKRAARTWISNYHKNYPCLFDRKVR